jgi:hypothetical protein
MRECRVVVDFRRSLIGRGGVDLSGVMISPKEQVTAQKYDLQFGTNVIGTLAILFGSGNC